MAEIAEAITKVRDEIGQEWLSTLYQTKVRTLRTRAYKMPLKERDHSTEIQHTLLGVELKVGNIRLSCPDLATARFIQVFARIGCTEIAIPYDISKISVLADELESAWQKLLLLIEKATENKTAQIRSRVRATLARDLRTEIMEIGAGALMPEFKTSTKQKS
jgi:hypothetical protein